MNLISNAIGLTQFGFFKGDLCPISHNALIMDCFSRANLYVMPHVTVSSFGLKIDKVKAIAYALYIPFYGIPI